MVRWKCLCSRGKLKAGTLSLNQVRVGRHDRRMPAGVAIRSLLRDDVAPCRSVTLGDECEVGRKIGTSCQLFRQGCPRKRCPFRVQTNLRENVVHEAVALSTELRSGA